MDFDKPEEKVRQKVLLQMARLGFPKSLICIEKELSQLPHLKNVDIPKRRIDILCFGKDIHPKYDLYPLILIECKAVELTQGALDQLIGYNYHVKSYFLSLANDQLIKTIWYDEKLKEFKSVDFLPSYKQLLMAIK